MNIITQNENIKDMMIKIVSVGGLVVLIVLLYLVSGLVNRSDFFSYNSDENIEVVESKNTDSIKKERVMDINWIDPTEIPSLELTFKVVKDVNNTQQTPEDIAKDTKYYKVGTVLNGTYKGGDVIIVTVPCDGMCGHTIYYFLRNGSKITLLSYHSEKLYDYDYLDHTKFTLETSLALTELLFPEKMIYDGSDFTLENGNIQDSFFTESYKMSDLKLAFVHPDLGNVYTDISSKINEEGKMSQNGYYTKAPDGTIRIYSLDNNFYDKNRNVPNITWDNGDVNKTEYISTDRGGCGSMNYAAVVTDITQEDLKNAGKTQFGDIVYELKNNKHSILEQVYDVDYNPYDYKEGKTAQKMSYDKFIQSHPVFFWYDSMRRLIKFQRSDFIPQAECGKPVIYLYPEKTTEVSVQVNPKGGFTKTEPEYGNGWKVIATPNGELTEIVSNKKYPYLFWEGRGGIYETPKKGFVVKQVDVHNFLIEKLTKLGLNENERKDFMEFWVPLMTGSPYYFVTFLGNSGMDKIAPLKINPRPDTVIRILMDFTLLSQPIEVEGYNIRTPQRKGFTVVEWGGVLR